MDPLHDYAVLLAGLGALALLVAWLPLFIARLPLSMPILVVAIGAGLFSIPGVPLLLDPLAPQPAAEHLAELVVLISLMGAGLKLDRPLSWRGWTMTRRLILLTMPLSIGALSLLGWWLLGISVACALLLGAALAPTDPVLAADVQVGPPGGEETDEVRFALTSEAGLNDAAAFPFVVLALRLAEGRPTWISRWLYLDVLIPTGVGCAIGVACGWLLGWMAFRLPKGAQLSRTNEGFVSLAATLFIYGICEIAHGYGFIAVFLAAVTFRHTERSSSYHHALFGFSEGVERLLTMVVLLLLGGTIAHGLLTPLRWQDALFGVLALLLVRPAAGLLSLLALRHNKTGQCWGWDERGVIAFFGIRGIGSIYYLVYALGRHPFAHAEHLRAIIGFVVLASIILHGTSVTPIMRWLDRRRADRPVLHLSGPF